MDFRDHRPQRGFGRSERTLAKIAQDLNRFLTKAQRSLTYETLHLSSRQRETRAPILVECAEDLYQDSGIGRVSSTGMRTSQRRQSRRSNGTFP